MGHAVYVACFGAGGFQGEVRNPDFHVKFDVLNIGSSFKFEKLITSKERED